MDNVFERHDSKCFNNIDSYNNKPILIKPVNEVYKLSWLWFIIGFITGTAFMIIALILYLYWLGGQIDT